VTYDAIVAGAGPAGAALAGWLGREGLEVLLLDRARFPRRKPCGEGVLPAGARALAEMRLLPGLERRGRALRGLALRADELEASADFPVPGIGLPRELLDSELLSWALAGGRVRFEEGVCVDEPILREGVVRGAAGRSPNGSRVSWESTLLVCAQGIHSPLRERLGARFVRPARRRMALVGRLEGVAGAGDRVEVFFGDGVEAYLTPVGEQVNAALLMDGCVADAERGERLLSVLRSFPALAGRLERARLASPALEWGPLGGHAPRAYGKGFVLAGDSALALDPIGGEGISLALSTAREGARLLARRELAAYDAARRRAAATPRALARILLALGRRRWLRRRALRALGRRPELFARLVGAAAGIAELSAGGLAEALRLAAG
jgi:flavin-dependent dehydrogenase